MLRHDDYCTSIHKQPDVDILTRPLFDVNMRLFKSSKSYRDIVLSVCSYLEWWVGTKKEGYSLPSGVSGANAGIPFNIICFTYKKKPITMINPKIVKAHGRKIVAMSNCGSINLVKPVPVVRDEFVDVSFYDKRAEFHIMKRIDRDGMSFTIQHEVQHNIGVLITDPKLKPTPEQLAQYERSKRVTVPSGNYRQPDFPHHEYFDGGE